MKLKAGALHYVLVVAVIIAIIIFAFISLMYLQQKMTIKHGFAKETIANAQMGFDYLKGNEVPYDTPTTLDFFENKMAITTLTKKHWGIFDIAFVKSKIKNESFQKIGLLGTQNSKRDALYLQEKNTSLVLVGHTKIIGNVSLPKQGVKSGNISGTSYYGKQLIYGNTKTSTTSLPEINNIAFVKDFHKNYYKNTLENFELEAGLKRHQSFTENTLLYENTNSIRLANVTLSGNILIVSKTAILISPSAVLEDVILMAPIITIQSNVKGNFQAIATKKIGINSNCLLRYPTALMVFEAAVSLQPPSRGNQYEQQPKEENQIFIAKNSQVKGVLLFDSQSKSNPYNSQIKIDKKAIVTGEVYCTKNVALLGRVFGTVYTHSFIVKKAGGIYSNHIYDGGINSKKLPTQYAGLQINQTANAVAKWVD